MTDDTRNVADAEIAVEFHVADATAADLVKRIFADEEIFESSAFTGAEIITVVSSVKKAFTKLLDFFAKHRESFKDAVVKIGPDEVSLKGYTMQEIQEFMASGSVEKILKAMKKK